MTIQYSTETEDQVVAMITKGRTIEDVTVLLYMNEVYDTKAKCREVVTDIVEVCDIKPAKKIPMSHQLKEWYMAQGSEALNLTKDQIEKQATNIGMTKGSLKYYTDMYAAASEIAKQLLDNQ